jgi:hypothetical protein
MISRAHLLWVTLVVWGTHPAAAQERVGATVELRGCGALDPAPIREALELELGGAAVCVGLHVLITCDAGDTTIEISDPLTRKRTTRRLGGVHDRAPDAPRVLALVASELVLASWAELLIMPQAEDGSTRAEARARVDREREDAVQAAAASVERRERQPTSDAVVERIEGSMPGAAVLIDAPGEATAVEPDGGPRLWTDLDAGVRLRDGRTPFFPGHVGLRALAALGDDVALGVRASLELGQAEREPGSVLHSVTSLGLVVAWVSARASHFALELSAEGRLGWVRLDGRPSRSSVEGRTIDEALVDVSAVIAPTFELESLRLGVALELGACVVAPTGLVSAGPNVALAGFVGGLTLRMGLR